MLVVMGNVIVNDMVTDAVFWWATIFCRKGEGRKGEKKRKKGRGEKERGEGEGKGWKTGGRCGKK